MKVSSEIQKRIDGFPGMPSFCDSAISALRDPNADYNAVAESVKYDPGMTANILRVANSAYFGMAKSVTSLREAFVRIGMKKLLELIIANGIASRLDKPMPGYDLQPQELLMHSIWVAVASEEFCEELGLKTPDTLFTAGLLHDMGKIVLDDFVAASREKIDKKCNEGDGLSYEVAEKAVLGVNHAEVGAMIIDNWNLPRELSDAARWHHEPQSTDPESGKIVSIVHLSNVLACSAGIGIGRSTIVYSPGEYAMENLSMNAKRLEAVASRTFMKMTALKSVCSE